MPRPPTATRRRPAAPHVPPAQPPGAAGSQRVRPAAGAEHRYWIVVELADEDQQRELFEQLRAAGRTCRLMFL